MCACICVQVLWCGVHTGAHTCGVCASKCVFTYLWCVYTHTYAWCTCVWLFESVVCLHVCVNGIWMYVLMYDVYMHTVVRVHVWYECVHICGCALCGVCMLMCVACLHVFLCVVCMCVVCVHYVVCVCMRVVYTCV